MRIVIDRSRCVGGGNCVVNAPAVFSQDDADGAVVLLDPEPPAEQHDAVRQAVELCPAKVIRIEE